MTTKHKPATPLPWTSGAIGRNDHPYMLHAANAYPRLVEFVRTRQGRTDADALLRDLGESE